MLVVAQLWPNLHRLIARSCWCRDLGKSSECVVVDENGRPGKKQCLYLCSNGDADVVDEHGGCSASYNSYCGNVDEWVGSARAGEFLKLLLLSGLGQFAVICCRRHPQ